MNHNSLNRPHLAKTFFICLFFILLIYIFTNHIGLKFAFAEKYDVSDLIFENSYFMQINGVQLHYRIWKPPVSNHFGHILLIHGLSSSTFSWRYVVGSLVEQGYSVVAVDLPGFGLSQRKPAVSQSNANRAELMLGLIERIESKGPWHLVGHSIGGGVVVSMALQKTSGIEKIVLVAGLMDNRSNRILSLFFKSRFFRTVTAKLIDRFFLTKKRIQSFLTSAYGREPTTEELEGYYKPLQLEYTYLTLSQLFKNYSSDHDLFDNLNKIRLPVLCLWGSNDDWVPVSKGEKIVQEIPDAKLLLIKEAKHCPMETHPEIFNQYLLNFLE